MTSRSSRIDQPTLDLISTIAETQRASISAKALSTYFAAAGRQLLAAGLLVRNGDDTMTTSLVDHDDEPVPLIRSPDHGSHGYFSTTAGWVKVPPQQTVLFRLDMMAVIARLTAQFDLVARHGPIMLSPDLLWEIGDVRLGRRAERMPVWFARRLADEAVATKVTEVAKSRPAPRTRIVRALEGPCFSPSDHDVMSAARGARFWSCLFAGPVKLGTAKRPVPRTR
jgi:hypothetical protein